MCKCESVGNYKLAPALHKPGLNVKYSHGACAHLEQGLPGVDLISATWVMGIPDR